MNFSTYDRLLALQNFHYLHAKLLNYFESKLRTVLLFEAVFRYRCIIIHSAISKRIFYMVFASQIFSNMLI